MYELDLFKGVLFNGDSLVIFTIKLYRHETRGSVIVWFSNNGHQFGFMDFADNIKSALGAVIPLKIPTLEIVIESDTFLLELFYKGCISRINNPKYQLEEIKDLVGMVIRYGDFATRVDRFIPNLLESDNPIVIIFTAKFLHCIGNKEYNEQLIQIVTQHSTQCNNQHNRLLLEMTIELLSENEVT